MQLVFKQKIAIINKAGEKTVERLIAGVMKALLRENKHGVHIVPLGFFNRAAADHGTAFFGGSQKRFERIRARIEIIGIEKRNVLPFCLRYALIARHACAGVFLRKAPHAAVSALGAR